MRTLSPLPAPACVESSDLERMDLARAYGWTAGPSGQIYPGQGADLFVNWSRRPMLKLVESMRP